MNELVPIISMTIGGEAVQAVSARELHAFLEVQTAFKDWISRRIEEYGFDRDRDFCSFLSESSGGRRAREYAVTIDMAKELAMVERNEKGRQVRRYFIECEKRLLADSLSEATVAAMLLPSPLPWEKRFHAGFYRALGRFNSAARIVAAGDADAAVIDWLWSGWKADRDAVIAAGCAVEAAR